MRKKRIFIPLILIGMMIAVNILAWNSRAFSDFYLSSIFPVITSVGSFITGIFPFSVGEILIMLLIVSVLLCIPAFIFLLIFKKEKLKKFASFCGVFALWVFTFVLVTETFNCFILYHCTPFSERYFTPTEHTEDDLFALYGFLIDRANELSQQVERYEDGKFKLTAPLNETAKEAMKNISDDYGMLKGYYPNAKPIMSSFFMSQNKLLGIYFPFTLEANYNPDITEINRPDTVCHELAHLKGVIQENEANFISFLAGINSGSIEFQYSSYVNALEYVHNECYETNRPRWKGYTDSISPKITSEWFNFVPDDYWEKNKKKEIISTETVATISGAATDTSLKLNGVGAGIKSYSQMVTLLLDYYSSVPNAF